MKRVGLPMVVALNRMDVARRRGVHIDIARLSNELGMPVLPTVAIKRRGADALIEAIEPARWPVSQGIGVAAWKEPGSEEAEPEGYHRGERAGRLAGMAESVRPASEQSLGTAIEGGGRCGEERTRQERPQVLR